MVWGAWVQGSGSRVRENIFHGPLGQGLANVSQLVPQAFEQQARSSASSLSLSSLELSDTNVYEPRIRALLGTAASSCKVGAL